MTGRRAPRGASRTVRALGRLRNGIDRCVRLAADPERLAASDPEVSRWSVGQHLEHLVRADQGILQWMQGALDDRSPTGRQGRPSRVGRLVLLTGWIPRGRGRAPDGTVPEGMDPEELRDRLADLMGLVDTLRGRVDEIARSRRTRRHPILGDFTAAQWIRFLAVHHRHHDRILRDIGTD